MSNCLRKIYRPALVILSYLIIWTLKLLWKILMWVVNITNPGERNQIETFDGPHDVGYYETFAGFIGSVRFSRYEAEEGTYIYVHCLDKRWRTVFKTLLYAKRERFSKTKCFVYFDYLIDGLIDGLRVTTPIGVDLVNEIFGYE